MQLNGRDEFDLLQIIARDLWYILINSFWKCPFIARLLNVAKTGHAMVYFCFEFTIDKIHFGCYN